MPINNSQFAEGATLAATGGTAKTLVSIGGSSTGNDFYVDEDTSSITRRTLSVNVVVPKVNASAPGGYTQERANLTYRAPKVLANGNRTVNVGRIEISVDPETTAAERTALRYELAQLIFSSSFDDLFEKQNAQ